MCVRDDGRVVLGRDREVVGIGEAADVVADDRAGRARRVEHRRAPGVARERDVEARVQRLDRRDRPGRAPRPRRPRARARPSPRRRRGGRRRRSTSSLGPPEERVELEGRAAVVERVGRAVEDAHHERARGEVVDDVTEAEVAASRSSLPARALAAHPRGVRRPRRSRRPRGRAGRGRRPRAGSSAAVRATVSTQRRSAKVGSWSSARRRRVRASPPTTPATRPQTVSGPTIGAASRFAGSATSGTVPNTGSRTGSTPICAAAVTPSASPTTAGRGCAR